MEFNVYRKMKRFSNSIFWLLYSGSSVCRYDTQLNTIFYLYCEKVPEAISLYRFCKNCNNFCKHKEELIIAQKWSQTIVGNVLHLPLSALLPNVYGTIAVS